MKRTIAREQNATARLRTLIPVLAALLVVLAVLATAVGAVNVPFDRTVKIILKNWGLGELTAAEAESEAIIYLIRFPRVLVAVLVGAALSTSGAAMQGMFRNPMAEPGIIGVSSGAGLGAIIAISLGITAKGPYFMPLFASAGAVAASAAVYLLARKGGKIPPLTLILSGVAVSTFIGSITSILLTRINDYQVRTYLFWTMGGLKDRQWEHVRLSAAPIIICILLLLTFARDLNIMLLGEEEARAVGLNPSRTRKLLLLLTATATASAVSVSGSISFVGLITPHIMRLIVGHDHRVLLPASALAGSIFLVACDIISRVVAIPREIGVGIVTSMLGAPYFIYLLLKAKKEGVAM